MIGTDYLQQEHITEMDQSAQSPDCNPIEHIWGELGRAVINTDHTPHYLHELCQAQLDQLDQWADILVEPLQRLVACMRRRLADIIRVKGGNTRY